MIKVEIYKENLQELKNRIALVTLAVGIAFMGNGCSKDSQLDTEKVAYELIADSGRISGLYSYIIRGQGLESEKVYFADDYIKLLKIVDKKVYDKNDASAVSLVKNLDIVWPDCFKLIDHLEEASKFDINMEVEELATTDSTSFTVVYSSMTAKHNIAPETHFLINGQKEITKGDTFASTAIYYDGELVAYQQTGAGSNSQNVLDATLGNVDEALQTVSDYGLLTKTETIDYQEFNMIENTLVSKNNYTYEKKKVNSN